MNNDHEDYAYSIEFDEWVCYGNCEECGEECDEKDDDEGGLS